MLRSTGTLTFKLKKCRYSVPDSTCPFKALNGMKESAITEAKGEVRQRIKKKSEGVRGQKKKQEMREGDREGETLSTLNKHRD